jgi:hypothetical protein
MRSSNMVDVERYDDDDDECPASRSLVSSTGLCLLWQNVSHSMLGTGASFDDTDEDEEPIEQNAFDCIIPLTYPARNTTTCGIIQRDDDDDDDDDDDTDNDDDDNDDDDCTPLGASRRCQGDGDFMA